MLQSSSPCIDSGDPESELDPDETRADMGAYYFHQEGCCYEAFIINENCDGGSCFIPQCTENCDWETMQCWGSTGYCWCVDENGIEIEGTSQPSWEGFPDCVTIDLGDINGDGNINVIDIVIIVNLILGNIYFEIGDVNEDGQLNVIDVVLLVNWVLNGTGCSDESSWDYDMDGICDADDTDDDNDGALDPADSDDNNEYVCSDVDGDNCDDCSSGTFDPANDGIDMNGNGICDKGEANNDTDGDGVIDDEDSDPFNPYQCSDHDSDTCDDCSTGHYDTSNDGYDYDGDGHCDDGDCDDDNDGCQECWDYCP